MLYFIYWTGRVGTSGSPLKMDIFGGVPLTIAQSHQNVTILQEAISGLLASDPGQTVRSMGVLLSKTDLSGMVTNVAGFRGTVCKPDAWKEILRVIQDQPNPMTSKTRRAREVYEQSIKPLIQDLSPQDFELLIDLILLRSGWGRVSRAGGVQEGIDLDVENPAIGEHAYVQVKGEAGQKEFADHLERFRKRRKKFARMIFAVHKPKGQMQAPRDPAVQIWTADKIAQLVVRLGLGERLEKMYA